MLTENYQDEDINNIGATRQVLIPQGGISINSLAQYMNNDGLKGLEIARSMHPSELIQLVKDSNLRGRGGAGFPVGVKWETVASSECPTRFVVCNSAEGEPGTYKDRYLIRKNPYQLIEGILIAAHAVGA